MTLKYVIMEVICITPQILEITFVPISTSTKTSLFSKSSTSEVLLSFFSLLLFLFLSLFFFHPYHSRLLSFQGFESSPILIFDSTIFVSSPLIIKCKELKFNTNVSIFMAKSAKNGTGKSVGGTIGIYHSITLSPLLSSHLIQM